MIKPTVGRVVYFYKSFDADPLPAIITAAWGVDCINAAIFDQNGRPFQDPPTSIKLVQPESERPAQGFFCEWMPYQTKKSFGSESGEKAAGEQTI